MLSSMTRAQEPTEKAQETKLQSFFTEATKAYNEANYELAIDYYQTILEEGYESFAVYYNLANAYYKQNQIAYSIFNYEKALLLNPNDSDLIKNLNFAKKMTIDAIPIKKSNGLGEAYKNLINSYSISFWSYWTIGTMVALVLCYITYYFSEKSNLKRICFAGFLIFMASSIFGYANGSLVLSLHEQDRPAIVFETAQVLSEPNNQGIQSFELHEGTKVQVIEYFNDWSHIEISNGESGWLLKSQIKELKE